jgi:catechol 2,3-dioxygenase-like lactoylglutathione lyase family enzyme
MGTIEYVNFRPTLPVTDLDRAVAFYRDIIGFELTTFAPEYELAILGKGGAEVAVVKNAAPVSQVAYLYVKGVDELYAICQAKGAEISQELSTHPYGIRDFVLNDPDGHIIGIGERLE